MEFKDRKAQHAGRVRLQAVDGQPNVYDVILADGATEQGTPLNAETFTALKEELLDKVVNYNGVPGPIGPKGDKGDIGDISLFYTNMIRGDAIGDFYDEPFDIATEYFNRPPVEGENFLGIFYEREGSDDNYDEQTMLGIGQIHAVNQDTCNVGMVDSVGIDGVGIRDIVFNSKNANGDNVYDLITTTGRKHQFIAPKGDKGEKGNDGYAADSAKFVTVDSVQTVSGEKTFDQINVKNIKFSNALPSDSNSARVYVCKESNETNGFATRAISDSASASGFSASSTNLVTERDCYNAMPSINGVKASTASIYAPTISGGAGYVLKSNGAGSPNWISLMNFSGNNSPYESSATITLPSISVGQVGIDVRYCTSRNTTLTMNLPASGQYKYSYVISNQYFASKDNERASVGHASYNASGGSTVCKITGSTTYTTVRIIYYRVA